MKEKEIESYGVSQTKANRGVAIKLTSSNLRGLPDRLHLFWPGILIFVEYKTRGRKPRPNQIRWHDVLKALGFVVLVIDSVLGVDAMVNVVKRRRYTSTIKPCKHYDTCVHYKEEK